MIKYFYLICKWDPTTTLGQSGPGSDSNVGVLHTLQISGSGASPFGSLVLYPG